jgi:glycosyltransferase involved in cell wall biosynthesis
MRILLTSNASYAPPRGGSTRGNLAWLSHLASAGHQCLVVCTGLSGTDTTVDAGGITIESIHDLPRRAGVLGERIRTFQPDWMLVSSEDLSHVLLRDADACAAGRVVYLAHTPQFFPFGPESWNPDPKAAAMVRRAAAVVAIGHHMAGYVGKHAGVNAHVIHPPIYGTAPWPDFGRFDDGSVLMINPCRVKGIGIFAAVAARFPKRRFDALIGWGTTTADRELLAALPNVRLLESVPDIDEVLSRAAVLLMPSIWYEGFGLIVMEAMLRGIPVIASDSGGLLEAKEGTRFVIPVRPVERYRAEFDETRMPVPVEPAQDIEPWTEALTTLLGDRAVYGEESRQSRTRAVEFVSKLRAADFESMLARLMVREPAVVESKDRLSQLSAAKRELLLRRLRQHAK